MQNIVGRSSQVRDLETLQLRSKSFVGGWAWNRTYMRWRKVVLVGSKDRPWIRSIWMRMLWHRQNWKAPGYFSRLPTSRIQRVYYNISVCVCEIFQRKTGMNYIWDLKNIYLVSLWSIIFRWMIASFLIFILQLHV